mgnify:CR=1 FL=1
MTERYFKLITTGCIVFLSAGAAGCGIGNTSGTQEIKAVDVQPAEEQPAATQVPSSTAAPEPVNLENTANVNVMDYYNRILQNTYSMYGDGSQYALYDLDKDGIQEMILSAGTCEGDWSNSVYTVSNQAAVMMGSFATTVSLYEAEDGNGLYAVHGHMGSETMYQITKSGNQLGIATVSQRQLSGTEDYYSNANGVSWLSIGNGNTGETAPASEGTDSSGNSPDYILPDSSNRIIDPSEFGDFSINDMQMAVNEIYARHGRRFQDEGIQAYFDSKSWYSGTVDPDYFDESVLSDVERENIDTLSYWMQPELTQSNPSTVDKYEYGVNAASIGETDSTDSSGDAKQFFRDRQGYYTNPETYQIVSVSAYEASEEYDGQLTVAKGVRQSPDTAGSEVYYLSYNGDSSASIIDAKKGQVLDRGTVDFYEGGIYISWDTGALTGDYPMGMP